MGVRRVVTALLTALLAVPIAVLAVPVPAGAAVPTELFLSLIHI